MQWWVIAIIVIVLWLGFAVTHAYLEAQTDHHKLIVILKNFAQENGGTFIDGTYDRFMSTISASIHYEIKTSKGKDEVSLSMTSNYRVLSVGDKYYQLQIHVWLRKRSISLEINQKTFNCNSLQELKERLYNLNAKGEVFIVSTYADYAGPY